MTAIFIFSIIHPSGDGHFVLVLLYHTFQRDIGASEQGGTVFFFFLDTTHIPLLLSMDIVLFYFYFL